MAGGVSGEGAGGVLCGTRTWAGECKRGGRKACMCRDPDLGQTWEEGAAGALDGRLPHST